MYVFSTLTLFFLGFADIAALEDQLIRAKERLGKSATDMPSGKYGVSNADPRRSAITNRSAVRESRSEMREGGRTSTPDPPAARTTKMSSASELIRHRSIDSTPETVAEVRPLPNQTHEIVGVRGESGTPAVSSSSDAVVE